MGMWERSGARKEAMNLVSLKTWRRCGVSDAKGDELARSMCKSSPELSLSSPRTPAHRSFVLGL